LNEDSDRGPNVIDKERVDLPKKDPMFPDDELPAQRVIRTVGRGGPRDQPVSRLAFETLLDRGGEDFRVGTRSGVADVDANQPEVVATSDRGVVVSRGGRTAPLKVCSELAAAVASARRWAEIS
jgi:hypothetical protein